MPHRSEFFWFMFFFIFHGLPDTKHGMFCTFCLRQSSVLSSARQALAECFTASSVCRCRMSSVLPFLVSLSQSIIPMKSAKNAMRLMWWPPSETGGGSVLWAEPGHPDSAQQSVCLSCHDEHLSCPQSVWEEFLFPQLRRAGAGRGGRE